jgi:hypothetical protein
MASRVMLRVTEPDNDATGCSSWIVQPAGRAPLPAGPGPGRFRLPSKAAIARETAGGEEMPMAQA